MQSAAGKHDFCTILLLVLPKPVFCYTDRFKDQNKGNISKVIEGLVCWLVFSKLQIASLVSISNQDIKKQKLQ